MLLGRDSRHVVIQDEQASLATPDRCQFGHFRSERPFAAVDCILDFGGCNGCEEGRRQVGIEVYGCLIDTDYDDSITTLLSSVHG